MGQFSNYYSYVEEQAKDLADDYWGELIEEIKDNHVDLYEFFDDKVHTWVDGGDFARGVDLHDCADILEGSNNVETDYGLWEGQDPIKAVETMAFFTYRNDLIQAVVEYSKWELDSRLADEKQELEDLQRELKSLEERIETAEEFYNEFLDDETKEQELEDTEAELERLQAETDGCSEAVEEKEQFVDNLETTLEEN